MIKIVEKNNYSGKIMVDFSIPYNWRKIMLALAGLSALAIVGGVIWLLGLGVCWLWTDCLVPVACWIGNCAIAFWDWLCCCWDWILVALAILLSGLAFTKAYASKVNGDEKDIKWTINAVALAIIALLLLLFSIFNNRADKSDTVEVTTEVVKDIFVDVASARTYLDYSSSQGQWFKHIAGQRAKEPKSYEEAVEIIAQEWAPIVSQNINVKLTQEKLLITTLVAMRMGPNGFPKSEFLKAVNAGKSDKEIVDAIYFIDGRARRATGEEATQYCYILKLLWSGKISTSQLLGFETMSYRNLKVSSLYDANGDVVFTKEMLQTISKGSNNPTTKELLDL
ncbi:MAG: hypothetical protein R3Y43_03460 [Alphaproteobacteria bacterium]